MPLTAGSSTADDTQDSLGAFYFDLRSPEAYLAAERVLQVLPVRAEWIPVRSHELPAADTLEGFRCEADRAAYMERIAARAAALGLQPVRWPEPFPFDAELAQRAATYAKQIGRVVAFTLAAFRQAYAGARDLSVADNVVIAASACEMHPSAVLKGVELRSVVGALDDATALAVQRGVRDVPAVWFPDGRVVHGEAGLEDAAAAIR